MVKSWPEKEIEFLKKNYARMKNEELSQKIDRSIKGISFMAYKLKLKKDYDFYCETRRILDFKITKKEVIKLYIKEKKSVRRCSKELGISKNTFDHYLKKYKIKSRTRSEATKERFKWDKVWCDGLTKNNDKRLNNSFKKIKETWKKKEERKIRELEEEYKLTFPELLKYLYWNYKLTQEKIAQKLKMDRSKIISYMKQYEIKLRPNYEYIASLKGENHSMYGKTWEDVYGVIGAKKRKKFFEKFSRKMIIKRIKNREIPFFDTKIEIAMADELKRRHIVVIPQFEIGRKFVCDFAIPGAKLIVECDGDYWHANPKIYDINKLHTTQKDIIRRDDAKNEYIKKIGWKIIRFYEDDIKKDITGCVNKIENFIK